MSTTTPGGGLSTNPERWAVYAVPGAHAQDGPFASRLRDLAKIALDRTTVARRYGWHATLKAPFRTQLSTAEVVSAVAQLAARRPQVVVPELALRELNGFWALVPGAAAPELDALAAATVTELDPLRAPLTDADFARRDPARLTERQRELLAAWGYPYVLDEFRCHFTLSDTTDPAQPASLSDHARAGEALRTEFAGALGRDLPITALILVAEPTPGAAFITHSIHPLTAQEPA